MITEVDNKEREVKKELNKRSADEREGFIGFYFVAGLIN